MLPLVDDLNVAFQGHGFSAAVAVHGVGVDQNSVHARAPAAGRREILAVTQDGRNHKAEAQKEIQNQVARSKLHWTIVGAKLGFQSSKIFIFFADKFRTREKGFS